MLEINDKNILGWLRLILDIYPMDKKLYKIVDRKVGKLEKIVAKGGKIW